MTAKNTVFQQKSSVNIGGSLFDLSVPKVMGILNITPDSFYDGGQHNSIDDALTQTEKMLSEGAAILDVGAYSSRPGAIDISEEEEINRLIPVLSAIKRHFPEVIISVDTFRASVANAAVNEGAAIINDISGGHQDSSMFETVARLRVPYILMHMKGTPQSMVSEANYEHVFDEVFAYFLRRVEQLRALGVHDIILDPGFGFAKTREHSYELLSKFEQFQILGLPMLAGVSRKSMIYKFLGTTAEKALNGTTVANTIALLKGASILRVHDVKEAVEAVKIVAELGRGSSKSK